MPRKGQCMTLLTVRTEGHVCLMLICISYICLKHVIHISLYNHPACHFTFVLLSGILVIKTYSSSCINVFSREIHSCQ
jgi:hypothetical protein